MQRELHDRGRQLDVALLPIGHPPWWKLKSFRKGHLTSDDALELAARLKARWFIPFHWGTFDHVTSKANDAIEHLRTLLPGHARERSVRIVEPGQTFELAIEDQKLASAYRRASRPGRSRSRTASPPGIHPSPTDDG